MAIIRTHARRAEHCHFAMMVAGTKPIEPIYQEIGRRIQHAREKHGLSQAALGQKLTPPLKRAGINNIESAKQRILVHTLVSIARVLRMSPLDFLPVAEFDAAGVEPTTVSGAVRTDLRRQLSAADAERIYAHFKEESNEPTIRPKNSGEARGASHARRPPRSAQRDRTQE